MDVNEIRERVRAIYEIHAPEKLGNLDTVMERYKGHEMDLYVAVTQKYPDPHATPPTSSPAPTPGPAGAYLPPGTMLVQSPGQAEPANDEMNEIRKIIGDAGFLCDEHERRWEEACLGRIPLSTVCKDSKTVLLESPGWKLTSKSRIVGRWQRRYFVVISPFIYYFENEKNESPCHGVIYLPRADIHEIEEDGRTAIEIESRVMRRPPQSGTAKGNLDYSGFIINFDAPKMQSTWLQVLQKLAKMTPSTATPSKSGVAPLQIAPQSQFNANSSMSFSSPLLAQQSSVQSQAQPAKQVVDFPIPKEELVARIRRISTTKDPEGVVAAMIDFVSTKVTDPYLLWNLMEQIDIVEVKQPSATKRDGQVPEAVKLELEKLKERQIAMEQRFDEQMQNILRATQQNSAMAQIMAHTTTPIAQPFTAAAPDNYDAYGASQARQRLNLDAPMQWQHSPQAAMTAAPPHQQQFGEFSPNSNMQPANSLMSGMDGDTPLPLAQRMERMRARKKMLEEMMSDAPQ